MSLAYWLELIVAYLIERFGKAVLSWSVQQLVDYFRDHPIQGKECQQQCAESWEESFTEAPDDGTGPYFWER